MDIQGVNVVEPNGAFCVSCGAKQSCAIKI